MPMLIVKQDLIQALSDHNPNVSIGSSTNTYLRWILDTSFLGLLIAPHYPLNIAFTVAATEWGPDVIALVNRARGFVIDV